MIKNKPKAPVMIPAEKIHPFEGNPFKVTDNDEMNGTTIPYVNVLSVNSAGSFTILQGAPLNATATITVTIVHNDKSGEAVPDTEEILVPVTVVSRTYTATFVMNGGTIVDANGTDRSTIALAEESPIFAGLTFSRTGYLFGGWYSDSSFNTLFSETGEGALMPSSDITLYAKWIAHSFTLHFDANGGSVSETERLVLCDTEFGTLPTPTRTGYDFLGWFTAASGGTQVTASTSMATADDITVYAHWSAKAYSSSWSGGEGYRVTVRRTSSPYAGAATGEMVSGTTVYYGDVLSITYTKADYYHLTSYGKTSITVTGNVTSSDIYASAALNDVVGWVEASNKPSDAQIVDRKYSYNLTSYTTSSSSSLSGWTHYDTQRTGWGATQGPVYTDPSNGARNVWSEQYISGYGTKQIYVFYWWSSSYNGNPARAKIDGYPNKYTMEIEYYPSSTSERPIAYYNGTIFYRYEGTKWYWCWFDSEYSTTDYNNPQYSTRWYYQDPVYTYYFYKVESKESSSSPSGNNISNIVEWVKYRPK